MTDEELTRFGGLSLAAEALGGRLRQLFLGFVLDGPEDVYRAVQPGTGEQRRYPWPWMAEYTLTLDEAEALIRLLEHDLFFHGHGLSDDESALLLRLAPTPMLEDWREKGGGYGLVLADWLQDEGERLGRGEYAPLAEQIRESIRGPAKNIEQNSGLSVINRAGERIIR